MVRFHSFLLTFRMMPLTHSISPLNRYATSPALNSFTALIHSFYTSESSPFPAIHLTLDPSSLSFTAYTSSPIGTSLRSDHLTFVPVESSLQVAEQERPGLDLLTQNLTSLEQSTSAPPQIDGDVNVATPLATLHSLVEKVSIMLDQVLEYVRQVAAGEREGDEKVGRALLETVGHVPASVGAKSQSGTKKSGDKAKDFEEEFNAHLADVLMVSQYIYSISLFAFKADGSQCLIGELPRQPRQNANRDQFSSQPPRLDPTLFITSPADLYTVYTCLRSYPFAHQLQQNHNVKCGSFDYSIRNSLKRRNDALKIARSPHGPLRDITRGCEIDARTCEQQSS